MTKISRNFKSLVVYIILVGAIMFIMMNIWIVATSAEKITGIQAGSWMAFMGVFLGQFAAYAFRYYEKHIDKKEEMDQSIKMVESIINNFLSKEINENLKLIPITPIKKRLEELKSGETYKQFGFSTIKFQVTEYDRIKYEIIKYNNELTLEVLEIYNLFYFMMYKKDLENMDIEDIEKMVKMYDKCVNKYLVKL